MKSNINGLISEIERKRLDHANAWRNLTRLRIRMYSEFIAHPEAPIPMRFDAAQHIALLTGAIESFTDSEGVTHRRVKSADFITFCDLMIWSVEDAHNYLPFDMDVTGWGEARTWFFEQMMANNDDDDSAPPADRGARARRRPI